jgi:adenosine deaminase
MKKTSLLEEFIKRIPKAELHLHIEGTLEPKLMFQIAKRNKFRLEHKSMRELKAAYDFKNLQEFLNIYYTAANVLIKEQDFYDLTWAYLKNAFSQRILHTEIFFDPQTHINRGLRFETIVNGIHNALIDGKQKLGISTKLIMCFLRDLDSKSAMKTLEEALPYKDWIVAVGLDSAEVGNPPSKFQKVFEKAIDEGFLTVAHAGEEGPVEYIWEALYLLNVSRIDHGNCCVDDPHLVKELVKRKIPLTLCPLSNLRLHVIDTMEKHPLKKMMEIGLMVTINSDDPAYFGGYLNENYLTVQRALKLDGKDIYNLAKNSFEASFLSMLEKEKMIAKLNEYVSKKLQK